MYAELIVTWMERSDKIVAFKMEYGENGLINWAYGVSLRCAFDVRKSLRQEAGVSSSHGNELYLIGRVFSYRC